MLCNLFHGCHEFKCIVVDNGGIQDMTTLQIEVKGQCEEFKVMLQPYAMYIPGQILIETPMKRMFRVSKRMENVIVIFTLR